ncbi:MAG: Hpt domain-containing protein [Thermodesulfobacteriota bacterium]
MSDEHSRKAPVFDQASVENRLLHDKELVHMVLHAFIQEMPAQIACLNELCAGNDIHAAERQAHSIKGACANVGAVQMRTLAQEAEAAARQAASGRLAELTAELEAAQSVLYAALRNYLADTV